MSAAANLAAYAKFEQQTRSRSRIVEIAVIVLLVTTWLTLALRFFVRGLMIMNVGWDDAAMLATNVGYAPSQPWHLADLNTGRFYLQLCFQSAWIPDWG